MTKAPKGKPYIMGSVKASTAAIALKKARNKYSGKNVSVKFDYRVGHGMGSWLVYSAHAKRR